MIRLITFIFLLLMGCFASLGQSNEDSLFSRLQAISNNGTDFFNIDGIEITSQSYTDEFSKKRIVKRFKKSSVKENDLSVNDSLIEPPNFYVSKTEEIVAGITQNMSYYFIENINKGLTAISFSSINKKDRNFERHFVKLIYNKSIPKEMYEPLKIDSINFAGRKIALDNSCYWRGINNVQCPYYGQINWSVHKTLEDASQSVLNQYNIIKSKKNGKIISEELVDVFFEETEVKAKKAVYDFKGISSLMAGMSGGKILTIYFVASPAKRHFVSCVMSFWNNDSINPGGLPPLLEKIMKLKK